MAGRYDEERIRKIISWIIDNENDFSADAASLQIRLQEQGYSSEEIMQAMLLLDAESYVGEVLVDDGFAGGARIFSSSERAIISLEAQGWLLRLRSSGWLSETQLSLIIESAGIEFRTPASLAEVMEIAERYMSTLPGKSKHEEIEERN